jgi:hypothetical protein
LSPIRGNYTEKAGIFGLTHFSKPGESHHKFQNQGKVTKSGEVSGHFPPQILKPGESHKKWGEVSGHFPPQISKPGESHKK